MDSSNMFMEQLPTMVALASFITPALDADEEIFSTVLEIIEDADDLLPLIVGQSVWIHVLIEALVAAGGLGSVDGYLQRLGLTAVPGMGAV